MKMQFVGKKQIRHGAALVFPGNIAPKASEFEYLASLGIQVTGSTPPHDNALWALILQHPKWGSATARCLRNPRPIPDVVLKHSYQLLPSDRARAHGGLPYVFIEALPRSGNPLRDRKTAFRWMRALLGSDGLIAMEPTSLRLWSPATLDEEICHDADLDIESLFTIHVVTEDGKPKWLHTHGLAEVGLWDFDVVRPSAYLAGHAASDFTRAVAFNIAVGNISRTTENFRLFAPDGDVRFVDIAEFNRKAAAADRAVRDEDLTHNQDRAILCQPRKGKGRLSRLFDRPVPCKSLSQTPEHMMMMFPGSATILMAERARQTYALFRRLCAEFAEFRIAPIAKIGYQIDGGKEAQLEHMWFEVHALAEDHLEATLTNQPTRIASMKKGDRGNHSAARLTDWAILTPAGTINPRNFVPARILRELPPEQRGKFTQQKS